MDIRRSSQILRKFSLDLRMPSLCPRICRSGDSAKSSQVNDDHRKQAWKPLFPAITKDYTNNITKNNFCRTET